MATDLAERPKAEIVTADDATLSELARRANKAHEHALRATTSALGKWAAVGELLAEAKARVGHGGFRTWVEANCNFGERQARKYIRISSNRAEVEAAIIANPDSAFGIDDAVKAIASPKRDTQNGIQNSDSPDATATPPPAPPPA
jgi:hypothetical protein